MPGCSTEQDGGRIDFTYIDRCSSEALPTDLISDQTASATARDTLVVGSIARRTAGRRRALGLGYRAGGGGARYAFDVLTHRRSGEARPLLRRRLASGSMGSKTSFCFHFVYLLMQQPYNILAVTKKNTHIKLKSSPAET